MIGSLDDMDEVEEGVLERIRATQLTKDATSLILDCVDQIVKTSFNGDRSAAGRHAAQIRWGNRGPKDLSERVAAMTAKSEAMATLHDVVSKDPTDTLWSNKQYGNIEYYAARRDQLGFGGPAQSATAEEMDALVETGKFIVVYRGAPDDNHNSLLTSHSDIGDGVMGHGTYTSPTYERAAGYGEVRAYLIPKVGITTEYDVSQTKDLRMQTAHWQAKSEQLVHRRQNAAYGQSENFGGTDDLLVLNVSMLIQGPKRWRPKREQTWDESHPWDLKRKEQWKKSGEEFDAWERSLGRKATTAELDAYIRRKYGYGE